MVDGAQVVTDIEQLVRDIREEAIGRCGDRIAETQRHLVPGKMPAHQSVYFQDDDVRLVDMLDAVRSVLSTRPPIAGRELTEHESDLMDRYGPCRACGGPMFLRQRFSGQPDSREGFDLHMDTACLWNDCE